MSRKTTKVKATNFFRPEFRDNISNAVKVCHEIAHRASLVLKKYYIDEFDKNPKNIIALDVQTVKVAFDVVRHSEKNSVQIRSERKLDPTLKKFQEMSQDEFEKFQKEKTAKKEAQNQYKTTLYQSLLSINNKLFSERIHTNFSLSHILNRRAEIFETSYINNVVFNFERYVKRLIRFQFGQKSTITNNTIMFLFPRECFKHKECQCNKKVQCPSESLEFVTEHFGYLIGKKFRDIKEFVEKDPWFFLNKMVALNRLFEDIEATQEKKKKLYSPLPIIRTFVPSHIHLDTPGLLQLLVDKNTLEALKLFYKKQTNLELKCKSKGDICSTFEKLTGIPDPEGVKGHEHCTTIWKFFCRLEDPQYKHLLQTTRKSLTGESVSWVFNNFIATDGVSMSVVLCKESEKRMQEYCSKRKKANLFKKKEFKGIKDLDVSSMDSILNSDEYLVIAVDPGKKNIITASNGQQTFKYTSKLRTKDMKVKKRAKSNNQKVLELSQEYRDNLSTTNSNSCYSEAFQNYVLRKFENFENVKHLYEESRFRSTKFLAYTLNQSSEDRMLNRFKIWTLSLLRQVIKGRKWMLEKVKDNSTMKRIVENITNESVRKIVLFYGTWGQTPNLKNSSPTPGVGLKRKLSKLYELVDIGEYMTSQTCPCCRQRNLEHPKFEEKEFKGSKHQLLRCQNADCDCKWWSRDNLGSFNIFYKGLEDIQRAREEQSPPSDNLR